MKNKKIQLAAAAVLMAVGVLITVHRVQTTTVTRITDCTGLENIANESVS